MGFTGDCWTKTWGSKILETQFWETKRRKGRSQTQPWRQPLKLQIYSKHFQNKRRKMQNGVTTTWKTEWLAATIMISWLPVMFRPEREREQLSNGLMAHVCSQFSKSSRPFHMIWWWRIFFCLIQRIWSKDRTKGKNLCKWVLSNFDKILHKLYTMWVMKRILLKFFFKLIFNITLYVFLNFNLYCLKSGTIQKK